MSVPATMTGNSIAISCTTAASLVSGFVLVTASSTDASEAVANYAFYTVTHS